MKKVKYYYDPETLSYKRIRNRKRTKVRNALIFLTAAALFGILFSFITTVLSVVTLVYAIQYIGSTPSAITGAVEPIIAVAISVWIFHEESLTLSLMLGIVIIIVGVLIDIIFNKK